MQWYMNGDAIYEIWKCTHDGQWHWRQKASPGETETEGEGYEDKAECIHALSQAKREAVRLVYNLTPDQ